MAQPRRKPSDRPKRRYIVFEVASKEPLGIQQVENTLQNTCDANIYKGMKFVHDTWDLAAKQGIVRVHHTHAKKLCDALASIKQIGSIPVEVTTIGMSGILRQAKLNFMKNKTIKKENKRNYHHRV